MTRTKSTPKSKPEPQRTPAVAAPPDDDDDAQRGWAWFTRAAFGLAVAIVLARVTMLETLREALEVHAGAAPAPRGPGRARRSCSTCSRGCPPCSRSLARAAVDPTFRLHATWSHKLMFALAGGRS
jgi:hypothetical protein